MPSAVRRRPRTITSTSCSTRACACASTIRAVSAACCGRAKIRCSTRCCDRSRRSRCRRSSTARYLARAAAGRSVAIKQLIMNGQVVVGVGNIYASEALFRAGIRPRRSAEAHHARGIRRARDSDQGRAARRRSAPAARRCATTSIRKAVPGYFPAEAVRLRAHARAVPRVPHADQAARAGTALDVFLSDVPDLESGFSPTPSSTPLPRLRRADPTRP